MEIAEDVRRYRTLRRLSQLELALRAGTTQRHLSFIESGRSKPGRDVVLRIATSLDLTLRQRNTLLLRAGYAPAYSEAPLDGDAVAPAMEALGHILDGHLPYPAMIVDRYGDIVAANRAFTFLLAETPAALRTNAYRAALHPQGMAARIDNFDVWAQHVLHNLDAALRLAPDERLAALRCELAELVPASEPASGLGFAVPLVLRTAVGTLRLMTTVSTFATAVDVTLSELKLEAFLPADRTTTQRLARVQTAATTVDDD
ncbi:MAG TPA: helix-turn-helix transcriptional regulator [Pseudonocardia sp.]